MQITFDSPAEAERVKQEALVLAYRASAPMGMGFLHARPNSSDDEAELRAGVEVGKPLYADYVAGRMVKLRINQPKPEVLATPDFEPRPDYQSWSRTYPTYEALINAAKGAS